MICLSNISQLIQPSLTRHIYNIAKKYDDVVDFTLGDPDIHPHQAIKNAGCEAIQQGKTRYSQNAGLLELRDTISKYYHNQEKLNYNPIDEIIVTVGAMEGLYLALLAILNPNDEVIILAPYYVNYVQMVHMCHARPVIIDNYNCDDLNFNINKIENFITKKTKAIIINTPSNPTGNIITYDELEIVSYLAIKYDLVIISDEVYKHLIYDHTVFKSIASFENMKERTILINSLSKQFCMTGWRIGYTLAPKEVISAMTKLQENIAACAPLPSQYAAIEALRDVYKEPSMMINLFSHRRNLIFEGINSIPRLSCHLPEATFYAMVNITGTGLKSEKFAIELLESSHVAVVPGITYGKNCDNYIRIAFTVEDSTILEGIKRIDSFVKQLA